MKIIEPLVWGLLVMLALTLFGAVAAFVIGILMVVSVIAFMLGVLITIYNLGIFVLNFFKKDKIEYMHLFSII